MPLVDINSALEELGLEKSDFMEFAGDLRSFLDETLPNLNSVIQAGDKNQIREVAHSIKGAVSNLRFIKAAEIAFDLEKIGMGQVNGDAKALYEALKICLSESFQEIGL